MSSTVYKDNPSGLSKSEKQVLNMLRNNKFLSIKVVKKNGAIDIIEGVERLGKQERIIDLLKEHKYQNLEIKQTNGKVVCVNRIIKKKIEL